ncbi:hypothetical protein P4O66_021502 [Electrophorus voltai]|uniref:LIM domain 7a n=1 Tax=Electrophorus voltai TaxID=2609070 RepID=A0AAD8ZQ14_9TELE|nr:hypothetical protein P4O66_021502 [Electrophorus voltai]
MRVSVPACPPFAGLRFLANRGAARDCRKASTAGQRAAGCPGLLCAVGASRSRSPCLCSCSLINKLKPGIIRRVNRLSTPMAGLDNVNVFLRACGKLGLNHSQLFHPGDLQDISNRVTVRCEETTRRLKNVLITIYWLGRKAQADSAYDGPQLNFKAFEGLLGVALSKPSGPGRWHGALEKRASLRSFVSRFQALGLLLQVLEESSCPKAGTRDGSEARERLAAYRREDSAESLDSPSADSDSNLLVTSEGFGSDAEAERCFRMSDGSRSETGPAPAGDWGDVPPSLRRKRAERHEADCRDPVPPLPSENGRGFVEPRLDLPPASAFHQWARAYQSDTDSDSDRPEPDPVQDDLASRRFRSTISATPVNYTVPLNPKRTWLCPSVTPSARRSWVTVSGASQPAAVPLARTSLICTDSAVPEGPVPRVPCGASGRAPVEELLLLQALSEASSDSDEGRGTADPVRDDLYSRRLSRSARRTPADSDKFLPRHWTPKEDSGVRGVRLSSQRGSWYRKFQGFRSKSVSDITSEPARQESDSRPTFEPWRGHRDAAKGAPAGPPAAEQVQSRQTPHDPTRAKDGEARWQDDLDRWKNRRRCVTSDLHRKKEEREQLHLLAGMGGADYRSTALHGGVEEESHLEGVLAIRQHLQAGPRGSSAAQGPSGRGVPPSRPLVPREDPRPAFAPSEASALTSSGGMPKAASSAAPGAISAMPADPAFTSVSPRETGASSLASDATEGDRPADQADGSTAVFFSPPGDVDPMETSLADWQRPVPVSRAKSMEGSLPGRAYASATLPKGFRRSEAGSRLSMGVTPRPFRAKPSKVASLPRLYSTDESHGSLAKTQRERPRLPASFGSQEKAETPDTEGCDVQTRKKREPRDSAPTIHSFVATSAVAAAPAPEAYPQSSAWSGRGEVCYSDLRVSLNQKPGRDFGLQTDWNSTGVYIRSVQPGGPAQLCHLQAGDEIVCVGGRSAAEMSYEQWKACMDAALHEGKLLMDVRRHGQNGWNSGPSSLPFKSDKTIDLTSMDSTSGGGPERRIMDAGHPGLPLETAGDAQVNSHPAKGLPLKAKNGSIRDGPAMTRNKGGSESAISDLQVPSIGTTASRWSWDAEEEKRRQEKWQMAQERLLQQRTPLSNGNATAYAPPPFFCQSASSTFALSGQHAGEAGPAQGGQVTKQPARWIKEECDSSTKTSQWKKSRSTPSLDSSHKQDSRAASKKNGRVSQAEQERRQILEEMRKTTPLHTDSSWIRQQSTGSVHKEPIAAAPVMRHESLDNLPTSSSGRPMPRQFSTRCSLGSTAPYRGYSSRCSLGPGAAIFSTSFRQRSTSASPSQPVGPDAEDTPPGSQQSSRLVSRRRTCSRCSRPLAKEAAMVVESLDLCFHIGCFKCVSCKRDLGRDSEAGAQVRVRRRQLFCDACYGRLRGERALFHLPMPFRSTCVPVSPCEQDVHHGDDTLGSAPGTAAPKSHQTSDLATPTLLCAQKSVPHVTLQPCDANRAILAHGFNCNAAFLTAVSSPSSEVGMTRRTPGGEQAREVRHRPAVAAVPAGADASEGALGGGTV